jgi:hypothetical protein
MATPPVSDQTKLCDFSFPFDGSPLEAYCLPIWSQCPIPRHPPGSFLQFPELRRVAGTDPGHYALFRNLDPNILKARNLPPARIWAGGVRA